MKHTLPVTFILISLFFIAQVVGLFTVNKYIDVTENPDGTVAVSHPDTLVGPQPDMPQEEKNYNFIPIMIAILVGTALLFVLIRFQLGRVWKVWFFLAIAISLAISFDVYLSAEIAAVMAVVFAALRIFKPNVIIHNFSEVFIYTGITLLILPWLNLLSGTLLLVAISIYDMIAVWKSKHMIKLAKFQLNSKMFAGLSMNYKTPKEKSDKSVKTEKVSNAILGGGDIAFPLLFSAAVMEFLIIDRGVPRMTSLLYSMLVTLGAGTALAVLLFRSKKDRFYPAMPFISLGCFIGFAAIFLIL